jgi:hypothetical protein
VDIKMKLKKKDKRKNPKKYQRAVKEIKRKENNSKCKK